MPDNLPDVQTVVADPDFHALPLGEKDRVLQQIDPDYAALAPKERMKALDVIHYGGQGTLPPIPPNYGFTFSNIGKNIAQFGKNVVGMARDVFNPNIPVVQGPNSLLQKYGLGPAQTQFQRGQQEIKQGNRIPGNINKILAQYVPIAGPMIGALGEQAGTGDIGGAATQAALTYGTAKLGTPEKTPVEETASYQFGRGLASPDTAASPIAAFRQGMARAVTEVNTAPLTRGMARGGVAAQVEKLANRIPIASRPLTKVYEQVASDFSQTISDAVERTAGIKADPTDLVGSMERGAANLKTRAQVEGYAPVDTYIENNVPTLIRSVHQAAGNDPAILGSLPDDVWQHPINGLKIVIDKIDRQAQSLQNAGRGLEAHNYFQSAKNVQGVLDKVVNTLPPELKASYQHGQNLWAQGSAIEELSDTFGKNVKGIPPGRQLAGAVKRPQAIEAGPLLEALKSEPRLRQAFGNDVANAIIQRTDRLGLAQSVKGGNVAAVVGSLYGTGLLARAVSGVWSASIPLEIGGIYALSKILATPNARPFYANMLRATTASEQEFWAQQAVRAAMGGQTH